MGTTSTPMPLFSSESTRHRSWEGRLFGALVLAAFVLYGVGSSMSDEPLGLVLVAANSIAVTVIGVVGYRLLQKRGSSAGLIYLGTRFVEAVLLFGGVALYSLADVSGADNTGYLLAMIVLGLGSLPFWRMVGQEGLLANRFALWGIAGYMALAAGATLELATGRGVTVAFAILGGLFELAVGIYLVWFGFKDDTAAMDGQA